MSSALMQINKRVAVLAKKFPGKKRKTLQKQAGKEYKAGKLKTRKKRKVGAVKLIERRETKRTPAKRTYRIIRSKTGRYKKVQRVAKVGKVRRAPIKRRRKKYAIVAKRIARRRSVSGGGSMKSILPIVVIGGVALLAYMAFKKPSVTTQYIPTGIAAKDNAAAQVLSWASTAGIVGSALSNILKALNNGSTSQVQNLASSTAGNPAGFGDSDDLNSILAEMGG